MASKNNAISMIFECHRFWITRHIDGNINCMNPICTIRMKMPLLSKLFNFYSSNATHRNTLSLGLQVIFLSILPKFSIAIFLICSFRVDCKCYWILFYSFSSVANFTVWLDECVRRNSLFRMVKWFFLKQNFNLPLHTTIFWR